MRQNPSQVKLNELLAKRAENDAKVKAIFDKADAEGRLETPDEIAQIKSINMETTGFLNEAENLKAVLEIRGDLENREVAATKATNFPGHGNGNGNGHEGNRVHAVKSLGQMFSEDAELQAWLKALGPISANTKKAINSPSVDVKSFLQESLKTLVTSASDTSAGALIFPDFKPIVDAFYQRPLTVRDLITIGNTGSDQVEYVRVTGVTNNSAGVAEAANTTDGDSSGRKPESAMAMERVQENVKTIAHWIPATSRALQDAGQLRSMIDAFLRYGLEEELEDQLINGAGGDDLTGILQTPDILTQSFSTDIFETTRKARTKIRLQGRTTPTAFLLHPEDVEIIDLFKDGNDRYYYGGPFSVGPRTLWGVPVVESEAVSAGQGLAGNFKMAILWDRIASTISVSNSHNDFFVRNLLAILAEFRAAFGVIRPQAFCELETQTPS